MANSRPSSALDDVAALDVESTEARRTESSLRLLLGASLVRPFWGWAPMDWGLPSASVLRTVPTALQKPTKSDMDAAVQAPKKQHKAHGHAHGTRAPSIACRYDDTSGAISSMNFTRSWADLFHDLIYVGAAYQLGSVVKRASTARKRTVPGAPDHLTVEGTLCVGLAIGVFCSWRSSSASCGCGSPTWSCTIDEGSDLAHRLHHCVTYLFIAMAASGTASGNRP